MLIQRLEHRTFGSMFMDSEVAELALAHDLIFAFLE
jgi:hypothetical protein